MKKKIKTALISVSDKNNLKPLLNILKKNKVKIISSGGTYKEIKRLKLSNHVKLLGQTDNISEVMNGLDLHILSSSYGEGFPNVIAESMACGTPCIATDVGDSSFVIGMQLTNKLLMTDLV